MAHELRPDRKLAPHRGALRAGFPRAPDHGRHTGRRVGQLIQRPARQPLAACAKTRRRRPGYGPGCQPFTSKDAREFGAPRSENRILYTVVPAVHAACTPRLPRAGSRARSPHPAPGQAARRARSQALAHRCHRSRRSGAHSAVGLGAYFPRTTLAVTSRAPLDRTHGPRPRAAAPRLP